MQEVTFLNDAAWEWESLRPARAVAHAPQTAEATPLLRLDAMALAAVALLVFLVGQLALDRREAAGLAARVGSEAAGVEEAAPPAPATAEPQTVPVAPPRPAVASPYEEYWVTQGPHGASYGHLAVDLAAGQGATVRSPIDGTVTERYVDVWGNPTLVIENERYRITLLHGEYQVEVGQVVAQGDPVGLESNLGYTLDMQGRSCRNRDCGYHTHLNVFDKQVGQNVNPLDLLGQ